jgi:hypothetical protein
MTCRIAINIYIYIYILKSLSGNSKRLKSIVCKLYHFLPCTYSNKRHKNVGIFPSAVATHAGIVPVNACSREIISYLYSNGKSNHYIHLSSITATVLYSFSIAIFGKSRGDNLLFYFISSVYDIILDLNHQPPPPCCIIIAVVTVE